MLTNQSRKGCCIWSFLFWGIMFILQLVFVGLKLGNAVSWTWLVVFIPTAVCFIVTTLYYAFMGAIFMLPDPPEK